MRRKIPTTETGSVAAINAPKTNAAPSGSPPPKDTIPPVISIVTMTPGIASSRMVPTFLLRWSKLR